MKFAIARQVVGSAFFNTINVPTVELHFQRSPGNNQKDRGIQGLKFQVEVDGAVIQEGETGKDGKIKMLLPFGSAQLQLMFQGVVVARYDVTLDDSELDSIDKKAGQQQRLRMLGFQVGHGGPFNDGVTGDEKASDAAAERENGEKFERSVLDFQVEIGNLPGNSTILDPLKKEAGL
jgi:hypothetical protein